MHKLTVLSTWLATLLIVLSASAFLAYQIQNTKEIHHYLGSEEKILSMAPSSALSFAALPKHEELITASFETKDARALVVSQFLETYGSPLAQYADTIIAASDTYGLPDFRIIPAIAMQESNGCKKLPEIGGFYNCWGYGIYGRSALGFDSYDHAIDRVARGLKNDYYNKGLVTPYQIMTKYTPPSLAKGGPWAQGVEYFMNQMR